MLSGGRAVTSQQSAHVTCRYDVATSHGLGNITQCHHVLLDLQYSHYTTSRKPIPAKVIITI